MVVDSKLIHSFDVIPIKITAHFFKGTDKLILKFIWKYRVPRKTETNLRKNKGGRLTLTDFKTYCTIKL